MANPSKFDRACAPMQCLGKFALNHFRSCKCLHKQRVCCQNHIWCYATGCSHCYFQYQPLEPHLYSPELEDCLSEWYAALKQSIEPGQHAQAHEQQQLCNNTMDSWCSCINSSMKSSISSSSNNNSSSTISCAISLRLHSIWLDFDIVSLPDTTTAVTRSTTVWLTRQ